MKKLFLTALVFAATVATAQVKVGNNPTTLATNAQFQVEGTTTADQLVVLKNGNVGIGTTAPVQKLDVAGYVRTNTGFMCAANGVVGAPAFFREFDPTGIYFPATSNLGFVSAGVERMRLDGNGNFGIGTTAPIAKLHVVGGGVSVFRFGATGTANYGTWLNGSTAIAYIGAGAGAALSTGTANDFCITPAGTGNLILAGTPGNFVGIGTGTPAYKLHVQETSLTAIYGYSASSNGVYGNSSSSNGIYGYSTSGSGVLGQSSTSNGGYFSTNASINGTYGLFAYTGNTAAPTGVGAGLLYAQSGAYLAGGYQNSYAGVASGDFAVTGNLSKGGGTFKIDHPQDPANKYLLHSFVESPDMMNVYNGNATTDATGTATITLPSYFEAENKDFRYQLTAVGANAQVWVATKIANNKFVVKATVPGVEVSWQVTGVRQDKWANANRVIDEVEKSASDKGKYIHPELFGQPASQGIFYINPATLGIKAELKK